MKIQRKTKLISTHTRAEILELTFLLLKLHIERQKNFDYIESCPLRNKSQESQ